MNENVIPEDLRRFIILNIDSVAELECLLLFHGNSSWHADSETVAQKLYIPEEDAKNILERLYKRRLLERAENDKTHYFYRSDMPELISRLSDTYRKYLVPVTNLIHSKPKKQIQKFADAFWIRKD